MHCTVESICIQTPISQAILNRTGNDHEAEAGQRSGSHSSLWEPYRGDLAGIVVESTYNWYWLVDLLQDHGYRVHLANPAAIQKYSGMKHATTTMMLSGWQNFCAWGSSPKAISTEGAAGAGAIFCENVSSWSESYGLDPQLAKHRDPKLWKRKLSSNDLTALKEDRVQVYLQENEDLPFGRLRQ